MKKVYLELQGREDFNEEGEDTIIEKYELIVPLTNHNEDKIIRAVKYALDGEVENIFCDKEKIIFYCNRGQGDFANVLKNIYILKNETESKVEAAAMLAGIDSYTLVVKLDTLYS